MSHNLSDPAARDAQFAAHVDRAADAVQGAAQELIDGSLVLPAPATVAAEYLTAMRSLAEALAALGQLAETHRTQQP